MLVTSALVVAQVPGLAGPRRSRSTVQVKAMNKKAKKTAEESRAPAKPVVGEPAVKFAQGKDRCPAGNLENLVQQYMRQARPLVRAELIFVRKVCELDVEQFRRIHQDTESAFKEMMTKFVEAQQQGQGPRGWQGSRPSPATAGS